MTDGALDLAEVTVRVEGSDVDRVAVDLAPAPDGYPPAPAWVEAATDGADQALAELSRAEPGRSGLAVTITQILGTVSDTRPLAVRCASGLAVWRGASRDGSEPEVAWGRQLHLDFPAVARERPTTA